MLNLIQIYSFTGQVILGYSTIQDARNSFANLSSELSPNDAGCVNDITFSHYFDNLSSVKYTLVRHINTWYIVLGKKKILSQYLISMLNNNPNHQNTACIILSQKNSTFANFLVSEIDLLLYSLCPFVLHFFMPLIYITFLVPLQNHLVFLTRKIQATLYLNPQRLCNQLLLLMHQVPISITHYLQLSWFLS